MTATKATGAPLLLVHVANSLWGTQIPAFAADTGRSGSCGPRLLTIAKARGAAMIVLDTRGKALAERRALGLVPGDDRRPRGGPEVEAVTRPVFDRAFLCRSPVPVGTRPVRAVAA